MVLVNITYLIGCCDLMLIQPWIKVMYWPLLWLTLHIRAGISISQLSISGIVSKRRCYISHCFFNYFSCIACISKTQINLISFLFKSEFLSFQICDSVMLIFLVIIITIIIIIFVSTSFYYYFRHVLFCYYFSISFSFSFL